MRLHANIFFRPIRRPSFISFNFLFIWRKSLERTSLQGGTAVTHWKSIIRGVRPLSNSPFVFSLCMCVCVRRRERGRFNFTMSSSEALISCNTHRNTRGCYRMKKIMRLLWDLWIIQRQWALQTCTFGVTSYLLKK